jgi:hypothetical protein
MGMTNQTGGSRFDETQTAEANPFLFQKGIEVARDQMKDM